MTRAARISIRAFSFGVLALSSCSKDEDPLLPEQFLASYPDAYCKAIYKCCESTERSYSSQTQCADQIRSSLDEMLSFTKRQGANASFDPLGAQNCLDKLAAADCSSSTLVGGCLESAIIPKGDLGDDCQLSVECKSHVCSQPAKDTPGSCGSQAIVGQQCSGDDRGCVADAYCDSSRVCQNKKAPGSTCGRAAECSSGSCSPSVKVCGGQAGKLCDG
jgi:hypothetical protein